MTLTELKHWHYREGLQDIWIQKGLVAGDAVIIPHPAIKMPIAYADELSYQKTFVFETFLPVSSAEPVHMRIIRFEGIAHAAEVYLNGQLAHEQIGGYVPFDVPIPPTLESQQPLRLTVVVSGSESLNTPPFGGVIDYLTYVGIYRPVKLITRHTHDVVSCIIEGHDLLEHPTVTVTLTWAQAIKGTYRVRLFDETSCAIDETLSVTGSELKHTWHVKSLRLWHPDDPHRYTCTVETSHNGATYPISTLHTGFRVAQFTEAGFFLNGQRLPLLGLNRHQSYPYHGYAADDALQAEDVRILKHELGVNIVRTAHYPQSPAFLEACDREGLLVFEEIPGWQHLGDALWKQRAKRDLCAMIERDRNHPSIVLWGVRINESPDDAAFYSDMNHTARALDPTRQTSGVRYLTDSQCFEDVYGFNDFSYEKGRPIRHPDDVTPPPTPILITEHTGHMYPVKVEDPEDRHLEHCLRHLDIINAAMGTPRIAGAIGWTLFDYQTHQDFGAGDGICHHGVLDIHRMPKHAAYVYASQGLEKPVLHVVNQMQPGDHPGGHAPGILILTNCDAVHIYRNDIKIQTVTPDRVRWPHLKHPAIWLDDLSGDLLETDAGLDAETAQRFQQLFRALVRKQPCEHLVNETITIEKAWQYYGRYVANWGSRRVSYRFEGVRKGCVVATATKEAATSLHLKIDPPKGALIPGQMVRLPVSVLDQNGNRVRYLHEPMTIAVKGAKLTHDDILSLNGGQVAIWLQMPNHQSHSEIKVSWRDQTQTWSVTLDDN